MPEHQRDRQEMTAEQDRAVHAPVGPTLVPAGPGSGKTTVTIERVAWMIRDMNIEPHTIVVFTFTNRAARELRARLTRELREADTEGLFAGTFHSWGARFLQTHGALVGLEEGFTIYDQDDSLEAIHRAMVTVEDPRADDRSGPRQQMRRVSRWKNRGTALAEMIEPWRKRIEANDIPTHARRLMGWQEYEAALRDSNAVDFDDLIVLPLKILNEETEVRQATRDRMKHILVDEYQDTSRAQHRLVTTLADREDGARPSLFVVGDSDQAIYAFREADIRNFNDFKADDYPQAREIHLENNYRSTGTIVDAAQEVIEHNRKRIARRSTVTRPRGAGIRWAECADPEAEAVLIATDIERRLETGDRKGADFCVAYRTNPQSRPIEEALRKRGIRYTITGNTGFFQRAEVKRHIDYVRLAVNPADQATMRRIINVPERSIGPRMMRVIEDHAFNREIGIQQAMEELQAAESSDLMPAAKAGLRGFHTTMRTLRGMVADKKPVGEIIKYVSNEAGLHDHFTGLKDGGERQSNIRELHRIANETKEPVGAFLERTAMRIEGTGAETTGLVTLSTIHQTKGLEFRSVYLAGVENEVLPLGHLEEDRMDIEEERRLLYVAMTRAEDDLAITWCRERPATDREGAGTQPTGKSSFIGEIPEWAWGEEISGRDGAATGHTATQDGRGGEETP